MDVRALSVWFFAQEPGEHHLVSQAQCFPTLLDVDDCQEAADRLAIAPPRSVVAGD